MTTTNKVVWGWTGMSHDASLAVYVNKRLVFAAHSERYSRIKNDKNLHQDLINEALEFGKPENVYFYENTFLKKTRQFYAKQYSLLTKESPTSHMRSFYPDAPKSIATAHHRSHAAAGFYTSPFSDAAVLVVDSIGEWETISIWYGEDNNLKRIHKQNYPHSVGIWYSAMTQRIGLKPQEHEYILMGMAAIGDKDRLYKRIKRDFIEKMPTMDDGNVIFKRNCHRGCLDWALDLRTPQDYADIAAATQRIYEEIFQGLVRYTAQLLPKTRNIVIMGGCALNCKANSIAHKNFSQVWIMPNPGDAGSAIGAPLAHWDQHVRWPGPYLGHNIEGEYPVEQLIEELKNNRITAVAAGKAEFGPRSLGNRSILADPRGDDVKDLVNSIKQREAFRPFAPAILEEYASDYFDGHFGPYMQYTSWCKDTKKFPAIIHYDGSSRVQTVNKRDNPGFRKLLEDWYDETGCPMLLNTSLNIKGEPLVNTREDAERWSRKYGVKVCLPK
jgi:carbamoyltransferase